MPRPKSPKPRETLYTSVQFRPYVAALGQLALAWNGLHETLSLLFCAAMGGGFANQYLAVWHAIKNDRAQRDMLVAAVVSNFQGTNPVHYVEDVKWLCRMADVLEEERNNALHSPLWAAQTPAGYATVRPLTGLGHERAKKLASKDLLFEFRWCRDRAIALATYAELIDQEISIYGSRRLPTWPERPPWPVRQGANKTTQRRQARQAEQTPPPQSSRA